MIYIPKTYEEQVFPCWIIIRIELLEIRVEDNALAEKSSIDSSNT